MSGNCASHTATKKVRGEYRNRRRPARQTVHNRKKKRESVLAESLFQAAQSDETVTAVELQDDHDDSHLQTEFEAETNTPIQSAADNDSHPVQTTSTVAGSSTEDDSHCLPINTGHLVISSFISRHHLSLQAQEDLLSLLNLPSHRRVDSPLPTSLYLFNKAQGYTTVSTYSA